MRLHFTIVVLCTAIVQQSIVQQGASQDPGNHGSPTHSSDIRQPDTTESQTPAVSETVTPPATGYPTMWSIPHSVTEWIHPSSWSTALELGMNGTAGNADALSLKTGAELERKTDHTKTEIDIDYAKSSAQHVETQHYALLKTRQDLLLDLSRWSWFTKQEIAYDEFKAFDVRWVINSGFGFRFLDSDAKHLTGRFGAGVSREFGGPDTRWVPEAVFGVDWKRKLTERQEIKATVDYLPSWDHWRRDFRLTADLGWQMRFDQPENLSLKLGIIDRYDNTPNGRRPNDFAYSLLLLWKK